MGLRTCLLLAPALAAAAPTFTIRNDLLSAPEIAPSSFRTGLPLAVVDCNGDGRDDLVRVHNSRFISVEFQTDPNAAFGHHYHGASATGRVFSIGAVELDDDGRAEILVGGNPANGAPAGLELLKWNGASYSGSWVKEGGIIAQATILSDLDGDADLDIFACHDLADLLKFENLGNGVFLENNALIDTALPVADDDAGNYGLLATDYDGDGDSDYYVSKCFSGQDDPASPQRINRLFRNDGASGYTEVASLVGLADDNQSWCADFGDVDNDGDLDCFVANHPYPANASSGPSGPSRLYRQNAAGQFIDDTAAAGLDGALDFPGAQAAFRDFDNDGWLDLLVSDFDGGTYAYFENDGDGTFTPRTGIFSGADGDPLPSLTSFATGDLNHDGFLDVYLSRGLAFFPDPVEEDLMCFNDGNENGFLRVRLRGPAANPDGIGARLELHGPWGVQVREVRGGEGYGIMHSLNSHFGMGTEPTADQLVIRWPSGAVDTLAEVRANHAFSVHEGVPAPSYTHAGWTQAFFPEGGADSGSNEDADSDRLPNLIEQFLGLDPHRPDGTTAIRSRVVEDEGTRYFQIEVDRAPAEDLTPAVEFLTAAGTWTDDPLLEVVENTLTRYSVRIPLNGADHRLARVVVGVGS